MLLFYYIWFNVFFVEFLQRAKRTAKQMQNVSTDATQHRDTFETLVKGQQKFEVCRLFLATLQLVYFVII